MPTNSLKTYKVDLGSSQFEKFAQTGVLYIDKTLFIEHVLDEPSEVQLFTRPRRMGKTLNLNMLKCFIDTKQTNTEELFRGYKIEKSHVYEQMNTHPVIWMSFRDFLPGSKEQQFSDLIKDVAKKYIPKDQMPERYLEKVVPLNSVRTLCKDIEEITGQKSFIIIDEYDKLYMDSANQGEEAFKDAQNFTKTIMSSCLKDNPHLFKACVTGVNRIAQESMFSDLNNIKVFGVFNESAFDEDYGLTEEEVFRYIENEDEQKKVRNWYNNYRVGGSKIYFTYSVMSYLDSGRFSNYWGQSGVMTMIKDALTFERVEQITQALSGKSFETSVNHRIIGEDLKDFEDSDAFYSLLIQTGYLTYDPIDGVSDDGKSYLLNIPNHELNNVWNKFILNTVYKTKEQSVLEIFKYITTPEIFQGRLKDLISNKLSYFDFDTYEPEKTYHVFVLGLFAGCGLKPISNREAGNGRYDLSVNIRNINYVFEFKKAASPEDKDLETACHKAITQIRDKGYANQFTNYLEPTYLVGVGFEGKNNMVRIEKL